MFTTSTDCSYRLPTSAELRWVRIKESSRLACESLCIALPFLSPLLADAFLR